MAQDILIVDDEKDIRDLIAGILEDEGYGTRMASNGVEALEEIKTRGPSLVILDVWLGDSERDGIKILETIKRDHPNVPVIMISGHGTIETAVTAIKKGAYDFIEKPFQVDRLLLVISRALESSRLKQENADLKNKAGIDLGLIGESQAITQIRQSIEKVALTNSRIFISGPSGCGKETVAREIHKTSTRGNSPFVVLNCASLPPDQMEVALFGADISGLPKDTPRKIGLIEKAHTGTLFLDEVTEMPLPIQAKLTRFLQDSVFCRLGSNKRIEVDVRVIASSSASVPELIESGDFREDLFYRLNVIPLSVPPLSKRAADIPILSKILMEQIAGAKGVPARRFTKEALVVLQAYPWPGNVRQLKNVIEWVLIMSTGDAREPVTPEMLPAEVRSGVPFSGESSPTTGTQDIVTLPLRQAREAFEREYLLAQKNRFGGNISQTAVFVGMERSALHRKLKALGIAGS